jgi:hypothetical protein
MRRQVGYRKCVVEGGVSTEMVKAATMKLIVAVAIALSFATPELVPQTQGNYESTKSTFTSPDGTFQFEHRDSVVECKRDPHQPDWWTPDDCEAFTPVCSDGSGTSDATIACVAYPAGTIKQGIDFSGCGVSVNEIKEANTESKCVSVPEPPPHVGRSHTEKVNGVKFSVTEIDGVATGNLIDGYVYRNFHEKKCYELDIRIAYSNTGFSDPGTVRTFDLEEVRGRLRKVLGSFEFLK